MTIYVMVGLIGMTIGYVIAHEVGMTLSDNVIVAEIFITRARHDILVQNAYKMIF